MTAPKRLRRLRSAEHDTGRPDPADAPTRGQRDIANGSLWMLASTGVVAIGSFVFWLVAARLGTTSVVGEATALFSAVFFLSFVGSLGLPVAVGRYGAAATRLDTHRFRLALAVTIASAALTTLAFVVTSPGTLLDAVETSGSVIAWLTLWLIVSGLAISILVDVRLMGQRRWKAVFVRSLAIGVIRLPPLVWAAASGSSLWVFIIAAGGYALPALPLLPGLVRTPRTAGTDAASPWRDHSEVIRYSGVNYVSQLALQAPFFVSPLVVALTVSQEENAAFYLSWGIMSVVYLAIHVLGRTLLVEGVKDERSVTTQARITLVIGFAVSVLALFVSLPMGPVFESFYGEDYDRMSTLLPLLMAGTIPYVITRTSLAVARVLADTAVTLRVAIWSAVTVTASVAIGGAIGDTVTAAIGWLVGSVLALVVSAPSLRRQLAASAS